MRLHPLVYCLGISIAVECAIISQIVAWLR
jgi:hypothetical protein